MNIELGQYYLVVAGYANAPGFLAPYRGVRYHLSEYRGRTPHTAKELHNKQHSQARNIIDRAFGVLKIQFRILNTAPQYPMHIQVDIIMACCVLHNFIRLHGGHFHDEELNDSPTIVNDEVEFTDFDDDEEPITSSPCSIVGSSHALRSYSQRERNAWNMFHDNLAMTQWNQYTQNRSNH